MLKIYGNRRSGNSNKVEYVAISLGMEYEYKEMDFQKDLKTPWYLAIHPSGKVPSIDDDGFILFESGAIVRYLCDKKGSSLYPKGLKERALVDQWTDFSVQHVGSSMSKVAFAKIFGPMMGKPIDEKGLAEGKELLDRYLPIVNNQLHKHPYLTGKELTLADLNLFASLEYADACEYDLSACPALNTWRMHLQSMDFFKKLKENKGK